MPIVWEKPDGRLRITQLAEEWLERNRQEGESTAGAVARLAEAIRAKIPDLDDAVPTLVKRADVPDERTDRARWRLRDGKVIVE